MRADADLFRQHIEHRQRVAVAVDRCFDRFVIEAAALVERAVALQRPADQIEAGGFRGLGVFGRHDLAFLSFSASMAQIGGPRIFTPDAFSSAIEGFQVSGLSGSRPCFS